MSLPLVSARNNWVRVSKASPCPICKNTGWCSISAAGTLAACRRVEPGCWKSKTDKAGMPVYLHRLAAGNCSPDPGPPPRPPGSETSRADADLLHGVYSALLATLPLLPAHREALRNRGLDDAEIDRRGYRSLRVQGRARRAGNLQAQFGNALLSVPGFVVKQGRGDQPYLTIAGAAGLLVPIRDPGGRIVALLVRRDDATDGRGKYSYLSSTRHGGPGPGSPVHVPLGINAPAGTVRLTEGGLKADIAFALSGLPTVGAAGLAWRPALDALQALGCKTVRLAFDADALDNAHVARALADCREALDAAGLAVELERWDKADGKGIDDLLADGKTPEVLTGVAAVAAITEALAAATAGEPLPPSDELERLVEVLATGGAAALFSDRPLLQGLASQASADPAAYAARRATLRAAGISLRDLDRALRPFRHEHARENPPTQGDAEPQYVVLSGQICRVQQTNEGNLYPPVCNFNARITEVITHDDGTEQTPFFTLAGSLPDGRELPPACVPTAEFAGLGWLTPAWHGEAVVYAGQGTRDHLRAALELLSRERTRRTVYTHTGWRQISGGWHYMHAGGAIGAAGPADAVEVSLPEPLAGFELPAPPEGQELVAAVRASLGMLAGLAADPIAFPLFAAVYRAALGDCDFSGHLVGPTGVFKSELTALCQQHYGHGLDARHLPGSWSSTGNALEGIAFAAKDALLAVDDFAPTGSAHDVQRFHRDADRVLRAQGNRAGRLRMRADATVRPAKPPRGLILSTGEDTPRGQSLRARLFVVEVSPGDVKVERLTACQQDAAAGLYAQALAGFLCWFASQYGDFRGRLREEQAEFREQAQAGGQHARTPGIVAGLALGLRYFLAFAQEVSAVTATQAAELWERGWNALCQAAADQSDHLAAAEPTSLFLRLLMAALGSGRAHIAAPDGNEPADAEAWGWRVRTIGTGENAREEWQPQGRRIGWIEEGFLYLEADAAYAEAQRLASEQGESLAVAPRTLNKRLSERGLLAAVDTHNGRTRFAVRRTLEGQRRDVLCLMESSLSQPVSAPSAPNGPKTGPEEELYGRTRPGSVRQEMGECAGGALDPAKCAAASLSRNGHCSDLAHLAHSDGDKGASPEDNSEVL